MKTFSSMLALAALTVLCLSGLSGCESGPPKLREPWSLPKVPVNTTPATTPDAGAMPDQASASVKAALVSAPSVVAPASAETTTNVADSASAVASAVAVPTNHEGAQQP